MDKVREFVSTDLRKFLDDGEKLLASASGGFNDYSFVVFPFAKVYEGFLKEFFYKIGAISEQQYHSDHWRVGKALNPQLEKELRHTESVYDRLVTRCNGGTEVAETLWQAWKQGRNQLFHYFPGHYQPLSLAEARSIISEIKQAMENALLGCKI